MRYKFKVRVIVGFRLRLVIVLNWDYVRVEDMISNRIWFMIEVSYGFRAVLGLSLGRVRVSVRVMVEIRY